MPTTSRRSAKVRRSPSVRIATALGATVIAAGVVAGTAACGAGQISQTADQQPAVNGGLATLKNLSLRDVQLVYPKENGAAVVQAGGPLPLFAVISNGSSSQSDTLTSITANSGTVSLGGTAQIGAGKRLTLGKPAGADAQPVAVDGNTVATAVLTGANGLQPGVTVPLTFHFEKSGDLTVQTPIGLAPDQPVPPSQTLKRDPWGGEH